MHVAPLFFTLRILLFWRFTTPYMGGVCFFPTKTERKSYGQNSNLSNCLT